MFGAWHRLAAVGAIALLVAGAMSCRRTEGTSVPKGVQYLGKITEPAIHESSGVAMSRRYPGVFWTHNDSGNLEVLYAITRNGALIGKWRVLGFPMLDWEDITFDREGNLLLADTGDNHDSHRYGVVHRIQEPDPGKCNGTVAIDHTWLLSFPKGPRNTESIFVLETYCYLITKRVTGPAEIYRFPLSTNRNRIMLELVGEMAIGSPVTSAALSPDAEVLAVMTHAGAFAYRIHGDVSRLPGLAPCDLTRFHNRLIEGCTFTPEGLLTTSETRHMYLFTNEIFRSK